MIKDFWVDRGRRYKNSTEFTEEYQAEVERRLGVKLPTLYIELLKQQNGGYIRFNAYPLNNSHIPVFFILGAYYSKMYPNQTQGILSNNYNTSPSRYNVDSNIIIFSGDDRVAIGFDCREVKENPPIVMVKSHSKEVVVLSNSFEEFVSKLTVYNFEQDLANKPIQIENTDYIRKQALAYYYMGEHTNKVRESCLSQVVRWEYAAFERYQLTPFYFERKNQKRSKAIKDKSDPKIQYRYGFNEQGQIVIIIAGIEPNIRYETYLVYTDKHIIAYTYHLPEQLMDKIEIMEFRYNQPHLYREFITRIGFDSAWSFLEQYTYQEDKLVEVKVRRESYPNYHEVSETIDTLSYDYKGELEKIERNNWEGLIYIKKLTKNQYLKLRESVINEMVEKAYQCLSGIQSEDQLCFANFYMHDEVHAAISNSLTLGEEKIRQELLKEEDYQYYIWNSSEYREIESVQFEKDTEFDGKVITLMRHLSMASDDWEYWWNEAKSIMSEVCQRLNQKDWTEFNCFTEDFVVIVDWSGFDETEDLAKSIPEEKMDILRERGLIPPVE